MARPLRIEYSGAWYHVMNRGASGRDIFTNDGQRLYFLSLLAETRTRFNAEWHAYCLMGNHYHLLVRTPDGNLQRIMRHINGLYTQYSNRTEGTDGTLFRGRYKAILVDAQSYWAGLSRYIHRNPLEANLCRALAQYRWSSYRAYAGLEPSPEWLTTDFVLTAISPQKSQQKYVEYVADTDTDADGSIKEQVGGEKTRPILGDAKFRARQLTGMPAMIDVPELASERIRPSLEVIVAKVAGYYKIDVAEIWRQTRGKGVKNPARSVAMYVCQHVGDMRLADIAIAFGLASYASAGATIRQLGVRLKTEDTLQYAVNYIILDLTPSKEKGEEVV